ncbi:hypothetical protein WA026_019448 [Henosepilachna vigintioctopunctata]|uniref:Endonuclease/exonuclease/phosphatase domain-containing protein n=1 Tax=Henosepilachna vigintioctopunctata TaxID=420089 RepID=A0AAW1U9J6_9CUCU
MYLEDLLMSFNLHTTSMEPTRVFTNCNGIKSATKIDYILTSVDLKLIKTIVIDTDIGDHRCLILSYCPMDSFKQDNYKKDKYRVISTNNLNNLRLLTSQADFIIVYHYLDVGYSFSSFFRILTSLIDESCPIRKIRPPSRRCKSWVTPQVTRAAKDLRDLHWLSVNLKSEEMTNAYRSAKNKYKLLLDTNFKIIPNRNNDFVGTIEDEIPQNNLMYPVEWPTYNLYSSVTSKSTRI